MAILEEIGNYLKDDSNLSELAGYLDTDVEEVKRPVGAAVSLMVAAVARRSQSETGASAMFDTVKGAGGSALDHVGPPFDDDARLEIGEDLVDGILGTRRTEIESGLAQKSGMATGQIQKLLPALAPVVIGAMGRRVSKARLSRSALVGELEGDRALMEREGLSSLLGLLDGGDDENDGFHFAEVMNRLNSNGGMQSLLPAARPVQATAQGDGEPNFTAISTTPGVEEPAPVAVGTSAYGYDDDDYDDDVDYDQGGYADTGYAASGYGNTGPGYAADDDSAFYGRPSDRRWAWILGGILALLLLILLIWQCGGDDGDTSNATDTDTTTDTGGDSGGDSSDGGDDGTADSGGTVELIDGQLLATARGLGTFDELLVAAQDAGLVDELEAAGPFTLFAPTDEAFRAMPAELRNDRAAMQQILAYHLAEGVVMSDGLVTGDLATRAGQPLSIEVGETVTVNGATVSLPDQTASNGVIHVIDQVLIPPGLTSTVTPSGQALPIEGLLPITFVSGSAEVTAEGQTELNKVAEYLVANPQSVEIQGHTDSTGDAATNQSLSEQRATAVLNYLVERGVDGTLLSAVGYGDTTPIADNATAEGQAANRRIEFVAR